MCTFKLNEIQYKRILGRNVADSCSADKPLALFWGASGLELNVKAKEVWIKFSATYDTSEPWVAVFVNGFQTQRFMITSGEPQWICVSRGVNPEKETLISVLKDTQAMSGDPKHALFIHEVKLSDDGVFCELKPRALNIEFIGDSITSGEGLAGGPDEGDWVPQWFCASKTYAVKASLKLNANWSCVSQCGWGICWGWDGDRRSVMPEHYEEVCSLMNGEYQEQLGASQKYNFGKGSDFVVLNLGTNDNGAFFQPPWKDADGNEYVLTKDADNKASEKDGLYIAQKVQKFLTLIRAKNPTAKIIWTWGMMKLVTVPYYINLGIENFKKETGDNKVYTLELPPMEEVEKTPEDKGSRGHPGPKTHELAALKIVDFINNL